MCVSASTRPMFFLWLFPFSVCLFVLSYSGLVLSCFIIVAVVWMPERDRNDVDLGG